MCLIQALLYTTLFKTGVERSWGLSAFSLIRLHTVSLLHQQASSASVGSVGSDATLQFYIKHSLLQVRAHPLKKCLWFGRHGFPAVLAGSNGDPVSHTTTPNLCTQWAPNNFCKKNGLTSGCKLMKKSACVFYVLHTEFQNINFTSKWGPILEMGTFWLVHQLLLEG